MKGDLRKKFHDDIRKKELEEIKASIRLYMLQKSHKQLSIKVSENEIINNMKRYIDQGQSLDYNQIFTAVEGYSELSQQFKNEFCQLVIEHLRHDWKCLKSLSILIQKCGLMNSFEKINICWLLEMLMDENSKRSAKEAQVVFNFIQTIFKKIHNKEGFRVLQKYEKELFSTRYQPFAIQLLLELAFDGILLPSSQCMEELLTWAFKGKVHKTSYFQNISKLLLIYVQINSDLGGLASFNQLVQQLIEENSFKFCKIADQFFFRRVQPHKRMQFVKKVSFLIGSCYQIPVIGLHFFSIFLEDLQAEERIPIIDQYNLVAKISYNFGNNHLDSREIRQSFQLLFYCLEASEKYIYQAEENGFKTILEKYKYHSSLSQLVYRILQMLKPDQ